MSQFKSVSILLPVMDEYEFLKKTVDVILSTTMQKDLEEIIFLVSPKTEKRSLELCVELQKTSSVRCRTHEQVKPFLGGALSEGFALARGSHVLMMASDLETDPHHVKDFIAFAKNHPDSIITATRWNEKGGFKGYDPLKLVSNYIFQKIFSLLYQTQLSDLTFGYRIFPRSLIASIVWEELRHPFLFETICKPLRLGVQVIEIPVMWRPREEGVSHNSFLRNFEYFRIGLKTLLNPQKNWIKRG